MSAIYCVCLIRFLYIKDKAAYDLLIAQCSVENKLVSTFVSTCVPSLVTTAKCFLDK